MKRHIIAGIILIALFCGMAAHGVEQGNPPMHSKGIKYVPEQVETFQTRNAFGQIYATFVGGTRTRVQLKVITATSATLNGELFTRDGADGCALVMYGFDDWYNWYQRRIFRIIGPPGLQPFPKPHPGLDAGGYVGHPVAHEDSHHSASPSRFQRGSCLGRARGGSHGVEPDPPRCPHLPAAPRGPGQVQNAGLCGPRQGHLRGFKTHAEYHP